MSGRWTEHFSFLSAVPLGGERLLVAAVQDEAAEKKLNLTIFFHWHAGKWNVLDQPLLDAAVGLAASQPPLQECVVLGLHGRTISFRVSESGLESTGSGQIGSSHNPPILRAIAVVGPAWFVAGMGREVYQRRTSSYWEPVDHAVRIAEPDVIPVGFQTLSGYSVGELYAAGFGGEVWSLTDGAWRQQDSPTNVALDTSCCCPDGLLALCYISKHALTLHTVDVRLGDPAHVGRQQPGGASPGVGSGVGEGVALPRRLCAWICARRLREVS